MKCRCPKGYPKTEWESHQVMKPGPTDWRILGLYRKHTGRCPCVDELLEVQLP